VRRRPARSLPESVLKPENIRFFESAPDFRAWLEANHGAAAYQWVGFYKKASGRGGLTYDEAVEEGLCFGWIDGQTNRVDENSVTVRFSPRRAGSNWSEVNVKRALTLIEANRMHSSGLRAFEARKQASDAEYTYETRPNDLPADLRSVFMDNEQAWEFWSGQPQGYRRSMIWWVVSAKRDETRRRRLEALMETSASGRRIDPLKMPKVSPG
jgi:uncharacterized protein YdeI (YjbR/CyaY-like superfamily)